MKRLFIFLAVISFVVPAAKAGSQPGIYSTNFWEIGGKAGNVTWIEIYNCEEAKTNGTAHVSVMTRKQGSPIWNFQYVCPHLAITTDALQRSVIHPFKTRAAYPESFYSAYDRWMEDQKKGKAIICTNSIQEFLKEHP